MTKTSVLPECFIGNGNGNSLIDHTPIVYIQGKINFVTIYISQMYNNYSYDVKCVRILVALIIVIQSYLPTMIFLSQFRINLNPQNQLDSN